MSKMDFSSKLAVVDLGERNIFQDFEQHFLQICHDSFHTFLPYGPLPVDSVTLTLLIRIKIITRSVQYML